MDKPSAQQLMDAITISRGHAYDVLGGREVPSLQLALQIYEATGWKHPSIADLADSTISDLAAQKPWAA